jgi:iron complex outermembrane receptor protein
VERVLTPTFRVTAEAFYNHLSNLIDQRVIDPTSGLSQWVNVNSNSAKGLEFEVEAQRDGYQAELSYTLQRSVDHWTGAVLANSPIHMAKMKLQAPLRSLVHAGFELQYLSSQSTYLQIRVPNALNANLTLTTTKPIRGFEFSASCYNLFDRRYYDPVSPGLSENLLQQDGREFRIQIARRFARN